MITKQQGLGFFQPLLFLDLVLSIHFIPLIKILLQ